MTFTREGANALIAKQLKGASKYLYALNRDYRRLEGRIKSKHYPRRVVEGELKPQLNRLRLQIDEEKAYCERDCLRVVDGYRAATKDNDGADEMALLVCEYVEQHIGEGYALGILGDYFDNLNKDNGDEQKEVL